MSDQHRVASDGLPARLAGAWARQKLEFLDAFVPPALQATTAKRDRIYLDLFAGPGLNIDRHTAEEFEGSPLRVLGLSAPHRPDIRFTAATFCNLDPTSHAALTERVARVVARGTPTIPRLSCAALDTNVALPELLSGIHPKAYVFAFADIEGVKQLPWTTVQALRAHHSSVDLYALVPVELSFNRGLGTNPENRRRNAPIFDAYFGHTRWRPIAEQWSTDAQGHRVRRELLDLYVEGLRKLWRYAEVVEIGRFKRRQLYYRMIFASNHEAGERIARWCRGRQRDDQGDLGL